MNSDITDNQTRNIVQGINLLLCYYPEAKLLIDYDKEIVMILPKEIRVNKGISEVLEELGWENLEYYPWMWQFKVDGDVAEYYTKKDSRSLVVERNSKGKRVRDGLLNDDGSVEWVRSYS